MSSDMSTTARKVDAPDRKERILREAVAIIATEGYGGLTMRALARASGIKLGALQYHFRTWEDLLRALATYVGETYRASFEARASSEGASDLRDLVGFVLDDLPGDELQADRLFPQLWAMARVEPVMDELLDEIYAEYVRQLEECLVEAGSSAPRAEALALMSLMEGSTLFVGHGRRWADESDAVRDAVFALIDARYGKEPGR